MSIRLDAEGAAALLRAHLKTAMKQLQGEFLREAQQGMRTPEGAQSLHEGGITDAAGIIAAEVIGGAWAAMDESGTGSLMDRSNPVLEQYMQSDMWNPFRGKHGPDDTTIRTRPPGGRDIFGRPAKGSKRPGINLEAAGKVTPQPPSHALQTAARWMANGRMQAVLRATMEAFPWHQFIVVDLGR